MPGDEISKGYEDGVKMGTLEQKMDFVIQQNHEIKSDVTSLRDTMVNNYVTKAEFELYQRANRNMITMVGVIVSILSLVLFAINTFKH